MKDSLRWAYGLNQWNFRLDVFVRREDHIRALQTLAATGFDAVELPSGTGRWDTIARPEVILRNHGTAEAFLAFLRTAGVQQVASLFWDPSAPAEEEEGYAFRFARNPADSDAIVEWSQPIVDFTAAVDAEQLVVRPAHSAWMGPPLAAEEYRVLGELWNRIGRRAADAGVGLALHYDCLSAVHTEEDVERLLAATDPALVGFALDTAELTIGGIDPVAFYDRHADRVTHVHLKDTRFRDAGEEYRMPGAESTMLKGGEGRRIERWFFELGTEGGLVDVPAMVAALKAHGYPGWVVVESDHGGNPAELAMLNSWYLQHVLGIPKT